MTLTSLITMDCFRVRHLTQAELIGYEFLTQHLLSEWILGLSPLLSVGYERKKLNSLVRIYIWWSLRISKYSIYFNTVISIKILDLSKFASKSSSVYLVVLTLMCLKSPKTILLLSPWGHLWDQGQLPEIYFPSWNLTLETQSDFFNFFNACLSIN